jgi:urease accessory protein
MKSPLYKALFLLAALLFAPAFAQAHPFHGETGLAQGFGHPLSGLDHLLAMAAVGFWAAQLGRRALWAIPAAFVGALLLGGTLGLAGTAVPLAEQGILASVFILGLFLALAVRLPLAGGMGIAGLFALFHGYAHGAEMPAQASTAAYFLGFAAATVLLHVLGIALGLAAKSRLPAPALRFAGAAVLLAGLSLALA